MTIRTIAQLRLATIAACTDLERQLRELRYQLHNAAADGFPLPGLRPGG